MNTLKTPYRFYVSFFLLKWSTLTMETEEKATLAKKKCILNCAKREFSILSRKSTMIKNSTMVLKYKLFTASKEKLCTKHQNISQWMAGVWSGKWINTNKKNRWVVNKGLIIPSFGIFMGIKTPLNYSVKFPIESSERHGFFIILRPTWESTNPECW